MADLHEREGEIAALEDALRGARGGAGRVVLIEGEAGIGKSRLIAAARELGEGFEVLHARGHELERDFAFGCVLQLFEPLVAGLGAAERERALAGPARHVALLLAGQEEPAVRAPFTLLHGLFWLAANLAERRPLLLCLDDGHWADPASLRFLLYLAARIEDVPLAAVVAARPAEPGAESELPARLAASPATTILRPSALSAESVGRIAAASGTVEPGPGVVRALTEATGGNPLLVGEVLVALAADPSAGDTVSRIRAIGPDPVMRALLVTLGRLPPAATALARAVAVLGGEAELEHAAELAGLPAREASECAGALARAGVFRTDGPLGFAHPVLGAALYSDLQPAERAFGHAAAARLLHGSSTAVEEQVAAHLVEAEPVREAWAVAVLRTAAARAHGRGEPASAARYLERAVREPGAELVPELLAELGRAEAALGRDSAASWLVRAAAAMPEPRARAETLRDLGRAHYAAGRFSDAVDAFGEALGALGDGADEELALALRADRATAALWLPERGAAALDGFLDPERAPRNQAERAVLANVAGAEFLRGEDRGLVVALALRAWDGGALLRDGGPDEPLISVITGTLSASDELGACAEVVDATLAAARESGSPMAYASASYLRGALSWFRGRVPDAVADAEAAVAAGHDGWELFLTGAHWILALALLERGEVDRAAAVLAVPPALEERFASSSTYCAVRHARGLVHLARGEPVAAAAELLATGDLVRDGLRTENPAFLAWRSPAAVSLARAGDVAEGRRLADEELALARRYGAQRTIGVALRARALVEPREADRVEPLRGAVEALAGSGARVEHARALADLGAALGAAGGPATAEARGCLRAALDLADAAGAVVTAERARAALVGAGGRPRRARTSGAAALTPAELRVARLAAEGLTNRQIAEHLFVTPKAVKWHLGNGYRKLGIDGREGLAPALEGDDAL